jgi:hypothetical protein
MFASPGIAPAHGTEPVHLWTSFLAWSQQQRFLHQPSRQPRYEQHPFQHLPEKANNLFTFVFYLSIFIALILV